MTSQDGSGVTTDLDQISQQLDQYNEKSTASRLAGLLSGINPNSFPEEGQSQRFLEQKMKDVSFGTVLRIAGLLAKGSTRAEKGIQTFKEMSDEYIMEVKIQRQEELITEQNSKIDDLQMKIKIKNEKISEMMKEKKESGEGKKQQNQLLDDAKIDIKALTQKVQSLSCDLENAEKRLKNQKKKTSQAQGQLGKVQEKLKVSEMRVETLKQTLAQGVYSSTETISGGATQSLNQTTIGKAIKVAKQMEQLTEPRKQYYDNKSGIKSPIPQGAKKFSFDDYDQNEEEFNFQSSIGGGNTQDKGVKDNESVDSFDERQKQAQKQLQELRRKRQQAQLQRKMEQEERKLSELHDIKEDGGDFGLDPAMQQQLQAMQKLKSDMSQKRSLASNSSKPLTSITPNQLQGSNKNISKENNRDITPSIPKVKIPKSPVVSTKYQQDPQHFDQNEEEQDQDQEQAQTPAQKRLIQKKKTMKEQVDNIERRGSTTTNKRGSIKGIAPGSGPKQLAMQSRKFRKQPTDASDAGISDDSPSSGIRKKSFLNTSNRQVVMKRKQTRKDNVGDENEDQDDEDELLIEELQEGDQTSTQRDEQIHRQKTYKSRRGTTRNFNQSQSFDDDLERSLTQQDQQEDQEDDDSLQNLDDDDDMLDDNEIKALRRKSQRRKTDASILLKQKTKVYPSEMKQQDEDEEEGDDGQQTSKKKQKRISTSEFDSMMNQSGFLQQQSNQQFDIKTRKMQSSNNFSVKPRRHSVATDTPHADDVEIQTDLTKNVLQYLLSLVPREIIHDHIKPPISPDQEVRQNEIKRIKKDRQDLFKRYGYKIRAGMHMYTNNDPFNRTFSGPYNDSSLLDNYDNNIGEKRIPRDAPSCLVKFSNAGGNMATKKAVKSKGTSRFTPNLNKTKNFYKKQWTIQNDEKELKKRSAKKTTRLQDNFDDYDEVLVDQGQKPNVKKQKRAIDITTAGQTGNQSLLRTSLESYGISQIKKG